MTVQIKISSSKDETKQIAEEFIQSLKDRNVNIFLSGELGAGKTEFVKGLFRGLGINKNPTSPTYDLVLSYQIDNLLVNHMDLYRLEFLNYEDAIWINQILGQESLNIIEWGNKFDFENLIKPEFIINISILGENERKIKISHN